MRSDQVHIQSPCAANWDAMRSDIPTSDGNPARFCTSCQKHVHDLSAMTRREAETLLERSRNEGHRLCVRYRLSPATGHLIFPRLVPSLAPEKQQHGVRNLLAAAALITASIFTPLTAPSTAAAAETPSDLEEQLWSQSARLPKGRPLGLTLEEEELTHKQPHRPVLSVHHPRSLPRK